MAIPIGTTSRQIRILTRWALVGSVIFAAVAWWRPGYALWGSCLISTLLLLSMWLAERIIARKPTVPGNPIHLVLLGPAVMIAYHLAVTGFKPPPTPYSLAGGLNMSLVFQLTMLSAIVMLSQGLMYLSGRLMIALAAVGAAVMIGAGAAIIFGQQPYLRPALGLLGVAGAVIWLVPLQWIPASSGDSQTPELYMRRRDVRMAYAGVAVIAAVAVSIATWAGALAACGAAAIAMLAGGIMYSKARKALLLSGAVLAAVFALCLYALPITPSALLARAPTLEGLGEQAFSSLNISAASSGFSVIGGMVGQVGVLWLLGGTLLAVIALLVRSNRQSVPPAQAVLWTMAMLLSPASMLAPGGLFSPVFTYVTGFVWGLAPHMLGVRTHARSSLFLMLVLLGLIAALGLADNDGLMIWSVASIGGTDKLVHAAVGFLLTLSVAWFFGRWHVLLTIGGIGIAALAGGIGELMQYLFTSRSVELADWGFHLMGVAAGIVVYVLAAGSRLAESADVRQRQPQA